jgi:hypothetical protein
MVKSENMTPKICEKKAVTKATQEASPIQIMEGMMGGEVLGHPPNREVFDGTGREARTAKCEMPTCCR